MMGGLAPLTDEGLARQGYSETVQHKRGTGYRSWTRALRTGGNKEMRSDGIVGRERKCDGNALGASEGRGGAEIQPEQLVERGRTGGASASTYYYYPTGQRSTIVLAPIASSMTIPSRL